MAEPSVYVPPLWLHRGAILRSKATNWSGDSFWGRSGPSPWWN